MCIYIYMYIHTHAYIHMCTHAYTYIYTYDPIFVVDFVLKDIRFFGLRHRLRAQLSSPRTFLISPASCHCLYIYTDCIYACVYIHIYIHAWRTCVYSRPQTVGIRAWDDACLSSFLSRLWDCGAVIFQLSSFYGIALRTSWLSKGLSSTYLVGKCVIGYGTWPQFHGSFDPYGP